MSQVIGLFPTPFMRSEKLLGAGLVAALVAEAEASASQANARSAALTHTEPVAPGSGAFAEAGAAIAPRLVEFGMLLFGESLPWAIKEMWLNVLEHGGHQAVHNHANSFVSGVVYLSRPHESAHTVFLKGLGGRDFVFGNSNPRTAQGPFNADKWITPPAEPGDLVLFPSYLLHEVPINQGGRRISLAFNAVPQRLDSWGYATSFS
ncbi:hypothetical protein BH11PSE9_BH11PSE9_06410 [soil metagenome]